MRILVADDDRTSQLVLKSVLTRWGHDVAAVGDGTQALQILEGQNPPALVILDWIMPGIDGTDICKKIRKSVNTHYIFIVLLTSRRERQDMIQGMDSGADVFLSKPVDFEELKIRVSAAERILSFRSDSQTVRISPTKSQSQQGPQLEIPETLQLDETILTDPILTGVPRQRIGTREIPVIGKLLLFERIGRGGMGTVYRGYNPRTRTQVAVKILSTALFRDDMNVAERFFREAQMAALINSPNVVRVFDIDQESNLLYLVMEYVHGESAAGCLIRAMRKKQPALDERTVLEICLAASQGLAAAHAGGVIHRDIKPENILVPYGESKQQYNYSGSKLADLGIAKHELSQAGLTATDAALGTVGFMSPEQIQNSKAAGKPSDIFGMGVTMYLLLTGRLPFAAESQYDTFVKTVSTPHAPVQSYFPGISGTTSVIIDTCLEKNPNNRYGDGAALVEDLAFAMKGVRHAY